jgi:hypothetical protein
MVGDYVSFRLLGYRWSMRCFLRITAAVSSLALFGADLGVRAADYFGHPVPIGARVSGPWSMGDANWWIAGGTVGLGVFTALLWWTTLRSVRVAEQALVMAERPWLACDVTMRSPLTYDEQGSLTLAFAYTVSNLGKTPAMRVTVDSRLVAPAIGVDEAFSIARSQKLYANEIRKRKFIFLDHVIFPGRNHQWNWRLYKQKEELNRVTEKVGGAISLTLIGIVSYQSTFDPKRHHTWFAYDIRRNEKGQPLININEGDIPIGGLAFQHSPSAEWFAD